MTAKTYMGIPREKIPWAPRIDAQVCAGCGVCVETCPNEVLVLDEEAGIAKVINPNNCVVLCDKCAGFCPEDAISFPDKEEFKQLLRQLREETMSDPSTG